MSDFDYKLHKIIGVARKKNQESLHASIYPLGYQDSNYHFQPFSRDMQKNIFLHNGTVFGYKFRDHLTDELIILHIRENEVKDDPTKDVYSADYETPIIKYDHTPIINVNKSGLSEAIKQGQYNSYYKVGTRIYYITDADSKKGIAKYWPIEDGLFDTNNNMCRFGDDVYLIRGDIKYPFKYSDILTNEEIVKYIIDLIRQYNIVPENLTEISDDLIKTLEIPSDILNFRFNVFKELLPSIVLTQKNILDLASNNILSDVLQRSIKEYEDEYIKTYEDHNRETIKKIEKAKVQKLKEVEDECLRIENEHIAKVNLILEDIKSQELKLKQVIDEINTRKIEANTIEQRFIDIEEHKSRLIEDFSIIRDVIGGHNQNPRISSTRINIESVTCNGEQITEFDDFCNHLTSHLSKNSFSYDSAVELSKNLARLFVAKNRLNRHIGVILLPSLLIFKSLIDAIGLYKLHSVSVGANWKSFDDLYCNGLEDILVSANNNPKEIHILLLQNMNLSYIPSYMQPINDILIGISSKLPGDHNVVGFPSNLWIFGTRTAINEEAIPISKSNIDEYGCVEVKDYAYSEDEAAVIVGNKFITMEFVNSQREEGRRYKSYPDSYLD